MYKKYSKKEIKECMKNISKYIYICDDTYREKFKQIKINDVYIPYIISSFGRVFSMYYGKSNNFNVKELKVNSNSTDYKKITIHYNNIHYNCWIHRLVAEAFIKNPKNKSDVNHIDGIKSNNFIWNLEWATRKENVYHAEINNLVHHPYGENNHSKMSEKTVYTICEMILLDYKPKDIILLNNISKNMFQSILHHRKWKHITNNYDFSSYKYKKISHKVQRLSLYGSTL